MMERVRQLCLSLPHVTEHVQWTDHLVFKIGGKMFAVTAFERGGPGSKEGNAMSWKTSSEEFPNLIERPGVIPAPYLARAKWVALERWDDMTWPDIAEQIQAAYEIVKASLPKRMQANLGSTNTAGQTRASKPRASAARQGGVEKSAAGQTRASKPQASAARQGGIEKSAASQTRASARVSKAVASTARTSGGESPRAQATSARAKSNSKPAPNKPTKKRSIQKSTTKTVRP
jgi:predicted DNA-binding protein (MmcQ/YjbR family)